MVVARREVAPAHEANSHCAEVAGTDGWLVDGIATERRAILDGKIAHDSDAAHGTVRHRSDGAHARYSCQPIENARMEMSYPRRVGVRAVSYTHPEPTRLL